MNTSDVKTIIEGVLSDMQQSSPAFVNLLLGTCAQESHMGEYERQIGGPALGIFQMEPNTFNDIQNNYLQYHDNLQTMVNSYMSEDRAPVPEDVVGNHQFAAAMAACSYMRHGIPFSTLDPNNAAQMYIYYKKYYNSAGGAATEQEFLTNWKTCGVTVDLNS